MIHCVSMWIVLESRGMLIEVNDLQVISKVVPTVNKKLNKFNLFNTIVCWTKKKSKSLNDFLKTFLNYNSLIWFPIIDFWCDIINGDLACPVTWPMSPLRSNVTIGMRPRATLLPLSNIGHVALHTGTYLYNVLCNNMQTKIKKTLHLTKCDQNL